MTQPEISALKKELRDELRRKRVRGFDGRRIQLRGRGRSLRMLPDHLRELRCIAVRRAKHRLQQRRCDESSVHNGK